MNSDLKTMLRVDFQRMFKTSLFYIMIGICLLTPILILVMTTMMDGTTSIDPQTGVETKIEGFKNVWQIVGSSGSSSMDITGMCNLNLVYFAISIFSGLFIGSEFRCDYVKNLFTHRAKKSKYIISKIVTCFIAGVFMIATFFIGSMLGGAFSGLSFSMEGFNTSNLIACLLSKIFLILIYVGVGVATSAFAKPRTYLSIIISIAMGALLFMTLTIAAPLNASFINVVVCIIGGLMIAILLGIVSKKSFRKK